jgi:hypothetical protein
MNLLDYMEKPVNPATKFIEWSGSTGTWHYFDKELKQSIKMPEKMAFIILEKMSAITGYNRDKGCGIYSNEVSNISTEILNVCLFKGGLYESGFYKDISGDIAKLGGKFMNVVYGALINKEAKTTELVAFKIFGSALSSFIAAKPKITGNIVTVETNPETKKNGATIFFEPIFKEYSAKNEYLEQAKVLAQILKDYRVKYSEYQKSKSQQVQDIEDVVSKEMLATNTDLNEINEEIKNKTKVNFLDLEEKEFPDENNEEFLPF